MRDARVSQYISNLVLSLLQFVENHFWVFPLFVIGGIMLLVRIWFIVRRKSLKRDKRSTDKFFLNLLILWLCLCILLLFFGLVM